MSNYNTRQSGWSATSTYKHTKTLNEYGLEYKSNLNNSVSFYIDGKSYFIYGKSNKVICSTKGEGKEKPININTDLTLLNFLKSKGLEPKVCIEEATINCQVFPFGKYVGMTLKEIVDFEPSYFIWVLNNITILKPQLRTNIETLLTNKCISY